MGNDPRLYSNAALLWALLVCHSGTTCKAPCASGFISTAACTPSRFRGVDSSAVPPQRTG